MKSTTLSGNNLRKLSSRMIALSLKKSAEINFVTYENWAYETIDTPDALDNDAKIDENQLLLKISSPPVDVKVSASIMNEDNEPKSII